MFENIGSKIKTLAKVVAWIGIVGCILTGIILMSVDEDFILTGLLIMIIGSFLSWISSFTLYGFGELIENTSIIKNVMINNGGIGTINPKVSILDKWIREGLITEEEYKSKKESL